MGLFTPIWMTDDRGKERKAKDAVRKVKDMETILEIAKTAPLVNVREVAMIMIDDEDVLYSVLKEEKDDTLRSKVVSRDIFANEDLLFEIAMNDSYTYTRQHAAWKITSTTYLERLVLESDDEEVQIYALKQLDNQKFFYDVYASSKSIAIRAYVATKFDNEEQKFFVASNDEDDYVRKHAIESMTDPDILAELVEKLSVMRFANCEDACKQIIHNAHIRGIGSDKHFATVIMYAPNFETKVKAALEMSDSEEASNLLRDAAARIDYYFDSKEKYLYGFTFYELLKVEEEVLANNILVIFDREEMVEPFIEKLMSGLQMGWTEQLPSIKWLFANATTDTQRAGISKLEAARDAAYSAEISHYKSSDQTGVSSEQYSQILARIRNKYYGEDE